MFRAILPAKSSVTSVSINYNTKKVITTLKKQAAATVAEQLKEETAFLAEKGF